MPSEASSCRYVSPPKSAVRFLCSPEVSQLSLVGFHPCCYPVQLLLISYKVIRSYIALLGTNVNLSIAIHQGVRALLLTMQWLCPFIVVIEVFFVI